MLNNFIERGKDCEPIILAKFIKQHPDWKNVRPARMYLRDRDRCIGCHPDAEGEDPDGKLVCLEFKTVSGFELKRRWSEASPPEHILLQALTQRILTNADYVLVVALDADRWELRIDRVDPYPEVEAEIIKRAQLFMADVNAGHEPSADYARDGALIAARYLKGEPNRTVDLRHDNRVGELCKNFLECKAGLKALNEQRDTIVAELADKLKDAEIGLVNGFKLTNKLVHKKSYVVSATDYRRLLITPDDDEGDE
jgi:predicted phage-related endonuclease